MIGLDALLAQTEVEPPCGPSLEYDPQFQELERAVQGKPEQVLGDHKVPAVPADWMDVRDRASALLTRSKDLRLAVWLTRALVHLEHIPGLAAGLALIEGLLARYWAQVHPLPDADDGDLTIRLNALSAMANNESLLGDLRDAVLVQGSTHDRITVRDAEMALGRLPASSGSAPGLAQIEAAMRDAFDRGQDVIADLRQAAQSCQAIGDLVSDRVGAQQSPDLKPLTATLNALLVLAGPAPEAGTSETAPEAGFPETAAAPAQPRALRTREDALRLLDAVCEYLERHEPTNPAPLLIRRAQRLMTMGFVDIIQDLAPDSLAQVRTIAGLDKQ
jgi:type VI secretion system protein ImpA